MENSKDLCGETLLVGFCAGTWRYKTKEYIDKQSAMSAAEKDIGRLNLDQQIMAYEYCR